MFITFLPEKTVYLTAAASTAKDCVYDLSITEYSTDNCPHNWSYEDYEEDDCYEYEYYVCILCGETKTATYEYHWWNYEYTHEAENYLDYSTGTRTCEECGKEEEFTEKGDNHTVASQEIDWIGNYSIEYVCTCALCGETFYTYEDSPCVSYDDEGDYIVSHSLGTTSSIPYGTQATCSVCGYVYDGSHSYYDEDGDDTYSYTHSYEELNGSDTCYLCTWTETTTCTKCGETVTETGSWESHSAWEYVQITPQHDNVCGTYNYCCAGCGAYEFEEPLTCHCYTTQTLEDGSTVKVCSRCGDVESTQSSDDTTVDTGN
ncbi:MAG: hypothetical protein LUG95_03280 [Clostridiales bacterium]|nr:hypothetical protein [Clostridiales bacterium]